VTSPADTAGAGALACAGVEGLDVESPDVEGAAGGLPVGAGGPGAVEGAEGVPPVGVAAAAGGPGAVEGADGVPPVGVAAAAGGPGTVSRAGVDRVAVVSAGGDPAGGVRARRCGLPGSGRGAGPSTIRAPRIGARGPAGSGAGSAASSPPAAFLRASSAVRRFHASASANP
jgi:hypothetical protein